MSFEPATLALLLLVGGWVAVDGTTVGQFMISRPLVAASLGGLIVGDPAAGAMVGLLLEAFHLTLLPVGASRYPEGGPAALVAGAFAPAATLSAGGLLTPLLFFILWSWVGGQSVHLLRKANIQPALTRAEATPAALRRRHFVAILADAARGMALVALGLVVFSVLLALPRQSWGLDPRLAQMATTSLLAALLASSIGLFGARRRLFLIGALAGLILLLVRT